MTDTESDKTGVLYIVGTPIGNLGDMSPRGVETLQDADYIAAEDTRVTLKLLGHFGIKKPLISYFKPREQEKSIRILSLLEDGNKIALVSDAGMPCISDPGALLVRECAKRGINVETVPGCNAAVAAVAASGLETERWIFEGFLPVDNKKRSERLEQIRRLPHTLVFYEAPHKLRQTLRDIREALGGERRCALCRELTKLHEEIVRLTLDEAVSYYNDLEPRGEYVIVVSGSAAESSVYTLEQAVELARQLIAGGSRPSDACRDAAKITGIPKRDIYAAAAVE